MKTIGFPISHKENENRRVVVPKHLHSLKCTEHFYFETNYGKVLGIDDKEYLNTGCKVVTREEVLKKDIICDLKVGDAEYLDILPFNTTIFGWIHIKKNSHILDKLIKREITGYAFEKLFKDGRHVLWRNNEIAGEAAVLHAYLSHGIMPYNTKVAVIGKGNTAKGAMRILTMLGAEVIQYNRQTVKLINKELHKYDVIVNCVLWDTARTDHIITKKELLKMKKDSLIIDVSCDKAGAIESTIPTTIQNPTYKDSGVTHYAVDHTPSLFYKTFSHDVSNVLCPYLEKLVMEKPDKVLLNSKIIENGVPKI